MALALTVMMCVRMCVYTQKLVDRLNKLHPRLDSYNNDSLNLIASLGRTPACARVAQLIEIRLFEVSTLWYSTNLKVHLNTP